MAGSRLQFSNTLQFWDAKSKECNKPLFPPASSSGLGLHQQVRPLSSRSGNKQYQCHSLNINKYRKGSPNRRFYCENSALSPKQSAIAKRSISYQEPTQVHHELLYRRNFSNPSPLLAPCIPVDHVKIRTPSQSSDIPPDSSNTSRVSSLVIHSPGFSESWSHLDAQPVDSNALHPSTPLPSIIIHTESLSSLNITILPSSQSGSNSSRHSILRDFQTHTPILEIQSPLPTRPWRPTCELWKLSDLLELHGGTGSLHIDSHGRVFNDENKYKSFLHEEEQRKIRMEEEVAMVIAQAREVIISEVELENVEEETTTGDDTIMRYLDSDESLKDSVEDEEDEVWGRIDHPGRMDETEDWWLSGDEHVSTESLRIAVKKILRVTNPDVLNLHGSLDSLGYIKHHTTPEASSIDISLLADISFEEPSITPVLTAGSTAPLVVPDVDTKRQVKCSLKRKSQHASPPRRTLYEKITHPVRSMRTTAKTPSTPINQNRKRFPIEDSPAPRKDTENRPPFKKQKTVKRHANKGDELESGSISSVKKPFRKALKSLSLRKYTMNNSSSEKLKTVDSKSEANKKENGPIAGENTKGKRSKRNRIDVFLENFLHAI